MSTTTERLIALLLKKQKEAHEGVKKNADGRRETGNSPSKA